MCVNPPRQILLERSASFEPCPTNSNLRHCMDVRISSPMSLPQRKTQAASICTHSRGKCTTYSQSRRVSRPQTSSKRQLCSISHEPSPKSPKTICEQVNMRCGGTDLPSTRVLTPRGPISVCHEGDRKMKHRPPPDGAVSILCGDTDKTSPGRRVLPEGAWPEPRFTCSAFLLFSLLGFVRHSIFRSPLLSQQRYWVPSSSTNRTGNTSRCRRGTGKE